MRGRCHLGNALEQSHVLGVTTKIIVTNQEGIGVATKSAVFLFIHLLEQHAHVVVHSGFQVLQEFLFAHVHQTQLQTGTGLGAKHHVTQACPRGFKCLEVLVVHDGVELVRNDFVNFCNALVDHGDHALVGCRFHAFVENLRCKLPQQLFCVGILRWLYSHIAFLNDAVKQTQFACFYNRGIARLCFFFRCHVNYSLIVMGLNDGGCNQAATSALSPSPLSALSSSVFCTMFSSKASSSSLPSNLPNKSRSC